MLQKINANKSKKKKKKEELASSIFCCWLTSPFQPHQVYVNGMTFRKPGGWEQGARGTTRPKGWHVHVYPLSSLPDLQPPGRAEELN